jgi:hypothetical protein
MTRVQMHRGAWIFVSHSHRDLEKVRENRNEPERLGCNHELPKQNLRDFRRRQRPVGH